MKPTDQWFKRQPVGVNKFSTTMMRMSVNAGLPPNKKLSNNSARKHFVQKLSDNNVPPTENMQIITGSALSTDLSFFGCCYMGFSRFWLTVADKSQGTSPSNSHGISHDSKGGKRQVSVDSATCIRK